MSHNPAIHWQPFVIYMGEESKRPIVAEKNDIYKAQA